MTTDGELSCASRAYTCTSWCTDGDGHPDCALRGDQSCWGLEHVTVLGLEEGAPAIKPDGPPPPSDAPRISVYAYRGWHALPTVTLHLFRESHNDCLSIDTVVRLTVEEAMQLADNLRAVTDTIGGVQ